jgi:DNA-binding PadR family transcriptional regulator
MGEKRTDLLRGTLDLLTLKALSLEPLHGVGISRRITQITRGAFQISFGSLFPSLHRMEEKGWVDGGGRIHLSQKGESCGAESLVCFGTSCAETRSSKLWTMS